MSDLLKKIVEHGTKAIAFAVVLDVMKRTERTEALKQAAQKFEQAINAAIEEENGR